MNEKIKEILETQMAILAERSKDKSNTPALGMLTHAMAELAPLIQSLSDGGLVSYPVQVQMSIQDLTDLYQERHIAQQQILSDNGKRLSQAL